MSEVDYKRELRRIRCEDEHLFFTRYFFKQRQNIKFIVNWHHEIISEAIEGVMSGEIENLIINVAPGSSKTEIVVVNLIARGLAMNPNARFLHLSYSDDLALLNSQTARDIITSDPYQEFWPLKIADDTKAKKRWNVLVDGKPAGGVYATSLGGQVTGFRAGHMTEGFQGAIIIDDPLKPEDGFSESKMNAANRKLITTVKSRKANPKTPIILVMQRIGQDDPTAFIKAGNLGGKWHHLKIPALIDDAYVQEHIPESHRQTVDSSVKDDKGRFSYGPYKEPLKDLLAMEAGEGTDATGSRISRHVYAAQYDQNPVALGGNMIHGKNFGRYTVLPKIKYRKIYCDTAQKTKERNDFSVFECWGMGDDGRIYLLDLIRDKWESPELRKRAIAFWQKHKAATGDGVGMLREMVVEDKSSGTDLIQTLKIPPHNIPVRGLERNIDKVTRVNDVLPYIDIGAVCIPENAPFTHDFVAECEAFASDMSHSFDDQVDPMVDVIVDMLSSENKFKVWEELARRGTTMKDNMVFGTKDEASKVTDGFDNFVSRLGLNNDNTLSAGMYTFNYKTRNRVQLEAAYRGSWAVGVIIDTIAEDMTRSGITVTTNEADEDIKDLMSNISRLQINQSLCDDIKWGRMYGGSIGVMQIKGQQLDTPLNPETIGQDQFQGLAIYDRWQLNPDLTEVIESGPDIGLPKFYNIVTTASTSTPTAAEPSSIGQVRVHHSRCVRYIGIKLPFFQAITEQMWGESVLERLWDRLISFDNVTMSTASLVDRANLRTVGVDGLRTILSMGGEAQKGLEAQFEMMRLMQVNEGLTLIDKEDTFTSTSYSFAGLADIMLQFGQQLSGACGIPLVRLFGQSPAGLSATGEADLRMYYDNIKSQQEARLRAPWEVLLKVLWRSTFGRPAPKDMEFTFTPLWQMSALDKATIAKTNTETILGANEGGLMSQQTAMKELRQNSGDTGLFTNISDEEIESAAEELPPLPEEAPASVLGKPVKSLGAEDSVNNLDATFLARFKHFFGKGKK